MSGLSHKHILQLGPELTRNKEPSHLRAVENAARQKKTHGDGGGRVESLSGDATAEVGHGLSTGGDESALGLDQTAGALDDLSLDGDGAAGDGPHGRPQGADDGTLEAPQVTADVGRVVVLRGKNQKLYLISCGQ